MEEVKYWHGRAYQLRILDQIPNQIETLIENYTIELEREKQSEERKRLTHV